MTEHGDTTSGHPCGDMNPSEMRLLKNSLGRIGHDLSNLLTPLTAYPDLIRMDLPAESRSQELMDVVVQTTNDMVRMARHMQDLSLCDDFHGQSLVLNDLVAATRAEFMTSAPGTVTLEESLCDDETSVVGGQDKLAGMVVRLMQNAVDAMGGFGVLRLRTERLELAEQRPVATGVLSPGACVVLHVEDTGRGFKPEELAAAFEPFFTTKRDNAKRGSGLGLTYCLLVVRAHGGLIDIVALPGAGTRVSVYLPPAEIGGDLQSRKNPDDGVQR